MLSGSWHSIARLWSSVLLRVKSLTQYSTMVSWHVWTNTGAWGSAFDMAEKPRDLKEQNPIWNFSCAIQHSTRIWKHQRQAVVNCTRQCNSFCFFAMGAFNVTACTGCKPCQRYLSLAVWVLTDNMVVLSCLRWTKIRRQNATTSGVERYQVTASLWWCQNGPCCIWSRHFGLPHSHIWT